MPVPTALPEPCKVCRLMFRQGAHGRKNGLILFHSGCFSQLANLVEGGVL